MAPGRDSPFAEMSFILPCPSTEQESSEIGPVFSLNSTETPLPGFPWNFFRQEYLSGLPFYSPRDLSKPICVSCVSMIARRSFTSELSLDMNENIIKQNEIKK